MCTTDIILNTGYYQPIQKMIIDNPTMKFNDFIESTKYKRIFTVIQQDQEKFRLNLCHLKIFSDIQ